MWTKRSLRLARSRESKNPVCSLSIQQKDIFLCNFQSFYIGCVAWGPGLFVAGEILYIFSTIYARRQDEGDERREQKKTLFPSLGTIFQLCNVRGVEDDKRMESFIDLCFESSWEFIKPSTATSDGAWEQILRSLKLCTNFSRRRFLFTWNAVALVGLPTYGSFWLLTGIIRSLTPAHTSQLFPIFLFVLCGFTICKFFSWLANDVIPAIDRENGRGWPNDINATVYNSTFFTLHSIQ